MWTVYSLHPDLWFFLCFREKLSELSKLLEWPPSSTQTGGVLKRHSSLDEGPPHKISNTPVPSLGTCDTPIWTRKGRNWGKNLIHIIHLIRGSIILGWIPIRIQSGSMVWWPIIKKFRADFWIKNYTLPIPRPPKRTSKLQMKPSGLKREHPALRNMKFL
jgi:hypothetical protein